MFGADDAARKAREGVHSEILGERRRTAALAARKPDLTGAQLLGPFYSYADPTAPLELANKRYADEKEKNASNYAAILAGQRLAITGDTMTGPLYLHADPTAPLQSSTKQYADEKEKNAKDYAAILSGQRLAITGDTMTGPLYLHADPTAPFQAATKDYVDSGLSKRAAITGAIMQGPFIAESGFATRGNGGAVSDASFPGWTPPAGALAVDAVNNRLYAKCNTGWKSVGLF